MAQYRPPGPRRSPATPDPDAGTTLGPGPSPWRRYAMTDADEVFAFVRATFADITVKTSAAGAEGVELRGIGAMLGDVALNGLRCTARTRLERRSPDLVNVVFVRGGRFVVANRRDVDQVAPGHVVLLPPDLTLELDLDAVESFTVGLPRALVDEVADSRPGDTGGRVRFEATCPVSAGLERHWLGTLSYVRQVVLADAELAANPLIVGQTRHLLASAALAAFPNTAAVPGRSDPGHVSPAVVRRAMGYVEAHADRYVSLAEMAEAAGVSPRALQYAFRRHQGTTPARYARRIRLDGAHRDLRAGDPGAGDTVTAIAARWGFVDAKRFATDYHAVYGQPPSRTLRA
ncbi:AraC family transcriptional regulator [Micromonospora sp. NPDC092111]|uniref:AraC family transcriptional regulator n=1 Tax=Micromonospora sp. NPDC092111 TaxID=3364289 RepID=UPI0037F963DC